MSQPIGLNYKSRIPTFSDDASIQEAFSVYHYGVDDYSTQPIPEDSIEGHFRTFNERVAALEAVIEDIGGVFVEEESSAATPNVIYPENASTVPLTLRGFSGQTAPLLRFQDSSQVLLSTFFPNGGASFGNYVAIGSTSQTSTTALNVVIGNAAHKGIVVRASSSPTANLQEWVASDGTTILARVNNTGKLFSNNVEVVTLTQTQTITKKTILDGDNPGEESYIDVNTVRVNGDDAVTLTATQTLTNKTISGGTVNPTTLQQDGVAAVTVSGTQTLTNKTLTAPTLNDAYLVGPTEKITVSSAAATGTIAFDCLTQTILLYTTNATANWGLNFRGSASVTMNDLLTVGESITVTFLAQQGTTAYRPTAFSIDGVAITPLWSGGTAPAAGNVSSIDGYTFTIIKRAANTYTMLAGQVQFK